MAQTPKLLSSIKKGHPHIAHAWLKAQYLTCKHFSWQCLCTSFKLRRFLQLLTWAMSQLCPCLAMHHVHLSWPDLRPASSPWTYLVVWTLGLSWLLPLDCPCSICLGTTRCNSGWWCSASAFLNATNVLHEAALLLQLPDRHKSATSTPFLTLPLPVKHLPWDFSNPEAGHRCSYRTNAHQGPTTHVGKVEWLCNIPKCPHCKFITIAMSASSLIHT